MNTADVTKLFRANLDALPRPVREALDALSTAEPATVDLSQGFARASVLTPAGTWQRIHSSPDPIATAEALVAKIAPDGNLETLIMVGLGLGYVLDALERRSTATKVLAVEPVPAITRAMLSRRDVTTWIRSGRLTLLVGPDYAGATDAWRALKDTAADPPVIAPPLLEREFAAATASAKQVVAKIIAGARSNYEAQRKLAGRYLLNTLNNLPVIAAEGDVAALAGVFSGVPAFVIGAGPSLDANVADLRRLQDRALLIAVDTAVRPLVAGGVRPHLVVAIDPSELNAEHLQDLTDTSGMWLVAEGSMDPSVFAPFAGRTFIFRVSAHHPWPWLAQHDLDRGTLQAWGSVLTTAFDLAAHAGCDPIVFAGADLAYTGGALYCANTTYEAQWAGLDAEARAKAYKQLREVRPTFMLPDVHGGEVLTAPQFVQFRDWLVGQSTARSDRRIVNATGAGILHGGRIVQEPSSGLSLPELPAAHRDLRSRISAAWSAGAAVRGRAKETLARATHASSVPMDVWVEFGKETASRADIVEALTAAASGRHVVRPKAAPKAAQPQLESPLPGVFLGPQRDVHEGTQIAATDPPRVITPAANWTYAWWCGLEPGLLDAAGRLHDAARFVVELEVLRGRVGVGWLSAGSDSVFIEEQYTAQGSAQLAFSLARGETVGRLVIRNANDDGASEFILRRIRYEPMNADRRD